MQDLNFSIGQIVHLDPATATKPQWQGDWKVVKINDRTVGLTRPDAPAHTRPMKADKSLVFDGPWPKDANPRFDILDNEYYAPGTPVRLRGKEGIFVVTGTSGNGYRLFPLGGSERYFRGVSARQMTRVIAIDGWVNGKEVDAA